MVEDKTSSDGIIYWDYEAQTKKKHEILQDYLEKWIWILGSRGPLNYFDCFGGCGKYIDRDGKEYYGSPIIAAKLIEENLDKKKRVVGLIIIEKEKKYIENLKKIMEKLKLKTEVGFEQGSFDETINKILDKYPKTAPSLLFIDPFGFSDIKIKTLERIMKRDKCEIVLNFMFNAVNRFIDIKQNKENMTQLFGDEEWKKLCDKEGLCREVEMVELIEKRFRNIAKHVTKFRFCFEDMNRTYYYIFHLTNHEKGCNIFKSCVKKHCGDFEFKGKLHSQTKIGEFTGDNQRLIEEKLIKDYSGKEKTFIEILKDQIDKVKGTEGDIKRAIVSLERQKRLRIRRIDPKTLKGKPRESIYNGDNVIFLG